MVKIEEIVGGTLTSIEGLRIGSEVVLFTIGGEVYKMYHKQECWDSVSLIC